jgi:hypothetical protein
MAAVAILPFRIEPAVNDPRLEFIFDLAEGLPPARQKRLVMRARDPEVGLLDDQQAEIALDALGLRAA